MSGPFRRVIPGCRFLLKQHLGQNPKRSYFMRPGGHWDPFSELQTSMREAERSFQRMEREMAHLWSQTGFPRLFPTFPRRIPLQTTGTEENVHRIELDLTGYKPEDVKVTLKDKVVSIEARMEHKGDDGSRFYQELIRQFNLPENTDTQNIRSLFSKEDGILSIEAPVMTPKKVEQGPTEIPINRIVSEDPKHN